MGEGARGGGVTVSGSFRTGVENMGKGEGVLGM